MLGWIRKLTGRPKRRKNPRKVRAKIRDAIREKRFFLYLVSVSPFLPLMVVVPWTALPHIGKALNDSVPHWLTWTVKVISFAALSFQALVEIGIRRRRFRRLLRRHGKRAETTDQNTAVPARRAA